LAKAALEKDAVLFNRKVRQEERRIAYAEHYLEFQNSHIDDRPPQGAHDRRKFLEQKKDSDWAALAAMYQTKRTLEAISETIKQLSATIMTLRRVTGGLLASQEEYSACDLEDAGRRAHFAVTAKCINAAWSDFQRMRRTVADLILAYNTRQCIPLIVPLEMHFSGGKIVNQK
jgi:hypothetical protein